MLLKPFRALFLAALLLAPGLPAVAASFALPDDALVAVGDFPFPEGADQNASKDLPSAFRVQMIRALRQAGIAVHDPGQEPEKDAAVPHEKTVESAPLTVTPLTESPDSGANGDTSPNPDSDQADPPNGEIPPGDSDTPPLPAKPRSPTHVLAGNVTLFRETVSNPRQLAGTIRIRAETAIHCAYQVKDASTDKVIISDVASGSAARLTSRPQDIDALLPALSERVLASVAAKIAANLSGVDIRNEHDPSSRSYYQDSPGKRLRPKK